MQRVYTITLIGSHIWVPLLCIKCSRKKGKHFCSVYVLGKAPPPPIIYTMMDDGVTFARNEILFLIALDFTSPHEKKSQEFPKEGPRSFHAQIC